MSRLTGTAEVHAVVEATQVDPHCFWVVKGQVKAQEVQDVGVTPAG